MRIAIVCVDPDPHRTLPAGSVDDGVHVLRRRGIDVRRRGRGLELAVDSADARRRVTGLCVDAFGTAPDIGSVTVVSRGTDDDALGVVAALGIAANIERIDEHGEEVAVVTVTTADRRRVPESRLHTALEAALNCEVRIVFSTPSPTNGAGHAG